MCNFIPGHLAYNAMRDYGGGKCIARTFSVWSHVVAMLYAHLSSATGLDGLCDALRLMSGRLGAVRGATPPSRNNLSHCNRERPAEVVRDVFWRTLEHLRSLNSTFAGRAKKGGGLLRRFRLRKVYIIDSTVFELTAACMDWAKHRLRKAAAKCHMRLDWRTLLPRFALIDTAKHNDGRRAREMCAGIRAGEIVVFDKAYIDFVHLHDLFLRGVWWVSRAKDNMAYRVVKRIRGCKGGIVSDCHIVLSNKDGKRKYPGRMRLVTALVEVDGREVEMDFLTNNFDWAASTVADIYKSRWQIEAFFKQLKQTFRLHGFLGTTANAVRWQVWTALLCYVLMKFLSCAHGWESGFARLASLIRSALWERLDLALLLKSCGTAGGGEGGPEPPQQMCLPGIHPVAALHRRKAAT